MSSASPTKRQSAMSGDLTTCDYYCVVWVSLAIRHHGRCLTKCVCVVPMSVARATADHVPVHYVSVVPRASTDHVPVHYASVVSRASDDHVPVHYASVVPTARRAPASTP